MTLAPDYLERRRVLLEAALPSRLPPAQDEPEAVHQAMHYAVAGGNRVRPLLTLAVADMAGWRPEQVINAACGVEFLHCASLILDDMPAMDGALFRRGKLCAHIEFNEATAVLAAVSLVALAFDLVAANAETYAPNPLQVVPAVRELALAMGSTGLVSSQHAGLRAKGAGALVDQNEKAHCLTHGSLFVAAVLIPAYFMELERPECDALDAFARQFGLAWQVWKGLKNAIAALDIGKPPLTNAAGTEDAEGRMNDAIGRARAALDLFGDRAEPLRKLSDVAAWSV